jgi:hypothetical protein
MLQYYRFHHGPRCIMRFIQLLYILWSWTLNYVCYGGYEINTFSMATMGAISAIIEGDFYSPGIFSWWIFCDSSALLGMIFPKVLDSSFEVCLVFRHVERYWCVYKSLNYNQLQAQVYICDAAWKLSQCWAEHGLDQPTWGSSADDNFRWRSSSFWWGLLLQCLPTVGAV